MRKNAFLITVIVVLALIAIWTISKQALTGRKAVEEKAMETAYTNRLINETSPYLLQHAHNPVDWFSWSDEAFEKAKQQDRPIFLSIGYSTCHWCHVMERESFSDKHIAKIMNDHFISIKVDREQRPDVDNIYMTAVQMMTGIGGWPLSVFLTPDGKPFYGGTYFPPTDSFGRPGFDRVLLTIADAWQNRRTELLDSAGRISRVLAKINEPDPNQPLSTGILDKAFTRFENSFDSVNFGFGAAPKFPQPTNLLFLLRYWRRTGNERALQMVEKTLDTMAKGGIYDHIGGGFHRYSTDTKWLVPHFEKMLYDQALLTRAYIEAWQITATPVYSKVAREVLDYILRDMTDPAGGFYSAEDADSEGKEGLFYLWRPQQIEAVLGKDSAEVFNAYYGVTEKGNFEEGMTILNVTESTGKFAKHLHKEPAEIETDLAQSRRKLLRLRAKRTRPYRDDKIIVAWNGLMISSLACAGAALGESKYIDAAESSAEFVLSNLQHKGRLARYWRADRAVGLGFLDDYAFMIMALLDLYEATFEVRWLVEAKQLADQMTQLFSDPNGGAFYLTGTDAQELLVRSKPGYDGVVPGGNSVAAVGLLRLGRMTMERKFSTKAEQILNEFSAQLNESPNSLSAMLAAVDFRLGPSQEIVIAGTPGKSDTRKMLKLIHNRFLPNAVVLFHPTGQAAADIEKLAPFLKTQVAINGKATAYVCENFICKMPVTDVSKLSDLLASVTEVTSGKDLADSN